MGQKFGITSRPALSQATLTAGTSSFVHLVHSGSLSKAEKAESIMPEICSACYVLSRRAHGTVLDLSNMPFGWLRKLVGQKRSLQGCGKVLKPDMKKIVELRSDNDEEVGYGDPRPVKPSRSE